MISGPIAKKERHGQYAMHTGCASLVIYWDILYNVNMEKIPAGYVGVVYNINGGHFSGHGNYSYDISKGVLENLRFDTATKQEVLDLVLYHDTVIEPTMKTVRRWLNKIGEHRLSQLLDVRMADIKAHAEGTQESRIERCAALGALMAEILAQKKCFSLKDLAINGGDILFLGVPQGKQIGTILHELLEMVIADTLPNDRDVLLKKAVELIDRP